MFDRLYTLTIHHDALPEKVLVIKGDSSKPSLNIEFSSEIMCQGVMVNGTVTIYGLTTEHINQMAAIRRYDIADNTSIRNRLTLAVGYREHNGLADDGKYQEIVLGGVITEAIPGPLPDRSLRISVMTAYTSMAAGNDETGMDGYAKKRFAAPQKQTILGWLKESIDKFSKDGYNFIVDPNLEKDIAGLYTIEPIPESFYEFQGRSAYLGIKVEISNPFLEYGVETASTMFSTLSSAGNPFSTLVGVTKSGSSIGDALANSYDNQYGSGDLWTLSEDRGMIGIPGSIQEGASVDVILKDIFHCGDNVKLKSTKFAKVSSTPAYEQDGVYTIVRNRIHGNFMGNDWTQTLTLFRGPKKGQ